MTPGQSGPTEIHEPEPVIAPVAPLPPPTDGPQAAPAAPESAPPPAGEPPARTLPIPPTQGAAPAPAPEQPAAAPPEQPANPEPQPQPAAAPQAPDAILARHEATIAALVSNGDQHGEEIAALQRQVRGLARNDLLLAGIVGIGVFLLGRSAARGAIDGAIEGPEL